MTTTIRPKWTDIRVGGVWKGLQLDLPQRRDAGLRVEVSAGRRLLVRQQAAPIVAARVQRWMSHVDYVRSERYRPVVPPIRADLTRRLAQGQAAERNIRWTYHFAAALADSDAGPLHSGRWLLEPSGPYLWLEDYRHLTFQQRWAELVASDPAGEVDWFFLNGRGMILCLRDPSAVDDGRVKAYRKQIREDVIAPVLLWWVSGLTAYLVLDGHDRLQACLAEGRTPPLFALSRLADDAQSNLDFEIARHTETVAHIERAIGQGSRGAAEALVSERRRFGRAIEDQAIGTRKTCAWPLPGGVAAWRSAARTIDPAWLTSIDPEADVNG
jgi:hypothetical protein